MVTANSDIGTDRASLERRVSRLATERGALFDQAGATFGLSRPEHERLTAIERELDECFMLRRELRAARDARRFARDGGPRLPTARRSA